MTSWMWQDHKSIKIRVSVAKEEAGSADGHVEESKIRKKRFERMERVVAVCG